MIVCQCNAIDHVAIETAASLLAAADPWTLLTPGRVYRALGARPRCGGCLPLAASIIHARTPLAPACANCPLAAAGADLAEPAGCPAPCAQPAQQPLEGVT